MKKKNNIIGVIGCGYVGLPLIFLLSRHFNVVGYDTNTTRINELLQNKDNNELKKPFFNKKKIFFLHQILMILKNVKLTLSHYPHL